MNILDKLNEAGEALKATGLDHVSITLRQDGSFSVGLRAGGGVANVADCFGHDENPCVAYVQASAHLERKARENAIKAEAERIARTMFADEERKAA